VFDLADGLVILGLILAAVGAYLSWGWGPVPLLVGGVLMILGIARAMRAPR
jgi:hypothetical protein